ncbi:MAG: hypothetical protein OEW30_13645 [Acidimicrobiia bacterium]|nr:hypothetical protein [Acidimicrobiia bacterium]
MESEDMQPRNTEATGVDSAHALLAEVGTHLGATRAHLRSQSWQWMLVWALVCLGAGVSAATSAGGLYWAVGAPLGILATAIVSYRIESAAPVRRKGWPYWTIGAGIGLGNTAASFLLPDEVTVVVVWVVFGLGFAGFSALERVSEGVAVFLGLAVIAAIGGAVLDDTFAWYQTLGFIFAGVIAGLALWIRSTPSR